MLTETPLAGSYNWWMIAVSVATAMMASYAALDLADRVTAAKGRSRWAWLFGGATAMGLGIWSMHYVGMLAFRLPVPVLYDVPEVLVSLVAAILASSVGLYVVSNNQAGIWRLFAASPIMGAGIAGMHYIGMAAMRLPAMCHHSMPLVTLSVALAIVISFVALWLALHFSADATGFSLRKLASALVMGSAIPVMHYTGMAAVTFYPAPLTASTAQSIDISTLGTIAVVVITFMVLALALITSAVDRRFSVQSKELQRSEQNLRQLVESVQVVLWRRNAQSMAFEFVNGEAKTLLGYDIQQWLDSPSFWDTHVHEDDRRACESLITRVLARDPVEPIEHRMIASDGKIVWLKTSVRMIEARDGRRELVGVMADITETKQAEERSRIATEAAEAASRAKSEFLANVSHELRTPINGVLGMTELALGTGLTEEQRQYVTIAKSSAEGLLSVINDILDFSKMEAGKLQIQKVAFSLRDTLFSLLGPFSVQAELKGLELICDIDPALPDTLVGDPMRLRQVATNLLGNAIKFTETGEVVLRVAEDGRSRQELKLHISVSDTGIGIDTEKHESIFQAFSQADGSTTRKYGGTGLGLTICRQLVEAMNGRIWVESEPGKGSTFHVALAVGIAQAASAEHNFKGLTVRIVSENPTARQALARTLSHWGVVTRLGSESAGLELVDWNPALDLSERRGETPTVVLTPLRHKDAAVRKCGPAVVSSLTKPFDPRRLAAAISSVLARNAAPVSPSVNPEQQVPPGRCLNILLAEDNKVNQKLATALLRKHGHSVSLAENGLEAVTALQEKSFDVVLMDVQMPVMDGVEATVRIREHEANGAKRTPIIAVTAHAMNGDRERYLTAGMDGYVSKPIDVKELLRAIEALTPDPAAVTAL